MKKNAFVITLLSIIFGASPVYAQNMICSSTTAGYRDTPGTTVYGGEKYELSQIWSPELRDVQGGEDPTAIINKLDKIYIPPRVGRTSNSLRPNYFGNVNHWNAYSMKIEWEPYTDHWAVIRKWEALDETETTNWCVSDGSGGHQGAYFRAAFNLDRRYEADSDCTFLGIGVGLGGLNPACDFDDYSRYFGVHVRPTLISPATQTLPVAEYQVVDTNEAIRQANEIYSTWDGPSKYPMAYSNYDVHMNGSVRRTSYTPPSEEECWWVTGWFCETTDYDPVVTYERSLYGSLLYRQYKDPRVGIPNQESGYTEGRLLTLWKAPSLTIDPNEGTSAEKLLAQRRIEAMDRALQNLCGNSSTGCGPTEQQIVNTFERCIDEQDGMCGIFDGTGFAYVPGSDEAEMAKDKCDSLAGSDRVSIQLNGRTLDLSEGACSDANAQVYDDLGMNPSEEAVNEEADKPTVFSVEERTGEEIENIRDGRRVLSNEPGDTLSLPSHLQRFCRIKAVRDSSSIVNAPRPPGSPAPEADGEALYEECVEAIESGQLQPTRSSRRGGIGG